MKGAIDMKCQRCKEREANVKIMKQSTGKPPQMLLLCDVCAREMGLTMPGTMDGPGTSAFDALAGAFMAPLGLGFQEFETQKPLCCPTCGLTREEFQQNGIFGCSDCYDVFAELADPIFCRTQMGSAHKGRKLGKKSRKLKTAKNTENVESADKLDEEIPSSLDVSIEDENANKDYSKDPIIIRVIEKKRQQLEKAVKEENYMEAAKLRDQIRQLKERGVCEE